MVYGTVYGSATFWFGCSMVWNGLTMMYSKCGTVTLKCTRLNTAYLVPKGPFLAQIVQKSSDQKLNPGLFTPCKSPAQRQNTAKLGLTVSFL
jgi:hypothetical protein